MKFTRNGFGATVCVVVGLCLYLPFLSRHYDLNGIAEAQAFDLGVLFSQNHMLYRPLTLLLRNGLHVLGIHMHTIAIMQILAATSGAVALGALYLALSDLTSDRWAASVGTAWLAISFSFWYFSTDVSYVVPSAMFAAVALALLTRLKSPILVGCAAALAILAWQANIFLLPCLAMGPIIVKPRDKKENYRYVFVLVGSCAAVVAVAYLLIAIFAMRQSKMAEIIAWAASYGGGRLPMWGQMALERVHTTFNSAGASIYPLNSRPALGELANANLPQPALWRPAFMAFLGLGIWPLTLMIWRRNGSVKHVQILLWLTIGYFSYLPFLVWWDPSESKWFVVPNLFLAAILGVLWRMAGWTLFDRIVAVLGILAIALSNLGTIWVRRFTEDPAMRIAQCVAEHMKENDLYIAYDWGWDSYLTYLNNRKVVSIIGESVSHKNRDAFFDAIDSAVAQVQQSGGAVYETDLESYSEGHLTWLQSQTRLTRAELERHDTVSAFTCAGLRVKRLALLPGIVPQTATHPVREVFLRGKSNWVDVLSPANQSPPVVGYGQLEKYSGQAMMKLRVVSHGVDASETVMSAVPAVRSGMVYVENGSGVETAMAITNPSNKRATVSFCFLDDGARKLGCGKLDLSPRSQTARFLSDSPFSHRAPCNAALRFNSTVPVAVLAMRILKQENGGFSVTNLPVASSLKNSTQTALLLPRIEGEQPYREELILLNPGSSKVSGSVAVGNQSSEPYHVLPGSFWRNPLKKHSTETSGPLVIMASDGLEPVPFIVRRFMRNDAVIRETSIPAAGKDSFLSTFAEFSASAGRRITTRTLLMVYNPTPAKTDVRLRLTRLRDARMIESTLISLPGGHQETFDLIKLPGLLHSENDFWGMLEVSTSPSIKLYMQVYRVCSNQSGELLLSPVPTSEERLPPTIDHFFPHLPVGEGYAFSFVFWGSEKERTGGVLRFFERKGDSIFLRILEHAN